MKRVEAAEMLDCDQWSAKDIDCALGAIRQVNRLYGGDRMHTRLFRRVAGRMPGRGMEILEVASARGEVLQSAVRMLQKKNFEVRVSLLDRSLLHLPEANGWPKDLPQPKLVAGDALAMPLGDNSVDVVSCCLFLHHLSAEDARAFLKEALRVARGAVVVNDLERTRTNYLLSRMQTLVDPSWLSRHDGPTSVRQAYTFAELEAMLRETGCRFELQGRFLFRLGAVIWKDSAGA